MSSVEYISSISVNSSVSSLTFSNIPDHYQDLVVISNTIMATQSGDGTSFRFNSNSSTTYSSAIIYADSSALGSTAIFSSNTLYYMINSLTSARGFSSMQIFDYANPNIYKNVLGEYTVGTQVVTAGIGVWANFDPITSITLIDLNSDNFALGTTLTLWGIK